MRAVCEEHVTEGEIDQSQTMMAKRKREADAIMMMKMRRRRRRRMMTMGMRWRRMWRNWRRMHPDTGRILTLMRYASWDSLLFLRQLRFWSISIGRRAIGRWKNASPLWSLYRQIQVIIVSSTMGIGLLWNI
jgi:hypothetical protein